MTVGRRTSVTVKEHKVRRRLDELERAIAELLDARREWEASMIYATSSNGGGVLPRECGST